ncbi:condensation domain-containing protein [Dactylosporangium sp. NPDC051485]|uniref:condensation domain-containing protein n=1 Tax=Dactylosporangium sp. NPDC051485 TaxID=3154846 RepID=UPI00342ECD63
MAEARVAFRGDRSGGGPLTWGQRAIWNAIRRTVPNDHYFNLSRVLALGGRTVSVAEATAALAALIGRHEALRTRIAGDPGEPRQELAAAGELPVAIVEGGDPEQLAERLAGTTFDYAGEWPLRAGLVTAGGQVSHVVLALCHLATDGHGAEILVRDLRVLIRRVGSLRPPATTPLALAEQQHSEDGRRRGAAALDYWAEQFARMPATMFPDVVAQPRQPRFWTGRIVSTAITRAVDTLAARHKVSGSTVLLTAAAALAAAHGGHPAAAVMPIVANRFTPAARDLVSTLSQDGLVVLDLDRPTFGELLRPGWQAAVRGYRRAAYDPVGWDAVLERAALERGTEVHPYCCYNDMRLVETGPGAGIADAATLHAARAETRVDFPATQERVACRYCLHLTAAGPASVVTLTADTAYLPPAAIEAHLRGLEELLVTAAVDDVPTDRLPALLEA